MDNIERDRINKQADEIASAIKLIANMTGDKGLIAMSEIPEVLSRIHGKLWDTARTDVTPENAGEKLAFFQMLELTIDNYIKRGGGNV